MTNEFERESDQISYSRQGGKEIIFQDRMGPSLILLEIDPNHFFAYWEISPEELSDIIYQTGDLFHQSRLILRIYEGNSRRDSRVKIGSYFDILVDGWKNKWYVEISNPNTQYYAELGLKPSTSDEFFMIKRSNVIKTPLNIISGNKQEQWMQVLGEYESVNMVDYEQVLSEPIAPVRTTLDSETIREYYANLSLNVRKGRPRGGDQATRLGESAGWLEFSGEGKPVSFPDNKERLSIKNYSSFSPLSSFSLSSEAASSFSSFSTLSSWQSEEHGSLNTFFHYHADLVIYGKTQPGAVLYIDGDQVKIQPDGTFSWRLNLSREGAYQIPLQVVLQGGEQITEFIPFSIKKPKKDGD